MPDSARFTYVAGDPSVDLVNTAEWPGDVPQKDGLTGYDRLLSWALGAGVLSAPAAERLATVAAADPTGAAAALAKAVSLRALLRRTFLAVARSASPEPRRPAPDGRAFAELNQALTEALSHLSLVAGPDRAAFTWRDLDRDLQAPLWPVVWAAAQLLVSDDARRIRVCAGEGCGWMYVDRSRNGMRRWCEMATCGTRAKNRRRALKAGRRGRGAAGP